MLAIITDWTNADARSLIYINTAISTPAFLQGKRG